jgi:hypothetical protein
MVFDGLLSLALFIAFARYSNKGEIKCVHLKFQMIKETSDSHLYNGWGQYAKTVIFPNNIVIADSKFSNWSIIQKFCLWSLLRKDHS